ncbi:glycosyltransferase family 4 protein [Pararhizobium mangrovi]|nr:glycosyltransferase family 4 protein [Pararhizobium mangrovi]
MRIAFVVAGLGAGGAEKIVNIVAHHRQDQGDEIHVLAINANDSASFFPYDPGIAVEALSPACGRSGMTLRRLFALRRRLQILKPDLVVSFLTKVNVLTSLASTGLPHALIASERNNRARQPMNLVWRVLFAGALRRSSVLVMQTESAARDLPKILRRRSVTIPNLVFPVEGEFVRKPGTPPRIVAVGRLDRQKGFDLLLHAFARVRSDLDTVSLTIFGEGPERDKLEELVGHLQLRHCVELPGVSASPGGWLRPGDIYVLSSRFEGFPNALLEALSAGMATISFDCPWGPAEIVSDEKDGILVGAEDVGGLARALQRLATDDALRERLAAAGPGVAARFAPAILLDKWDAAISRSVEIHRRLAAHVIEMGAIR